VTIAPVRRRRQRRASSLVALALSGLVASCSYLRPPPLTFPQPSFPAVPARPQPPAFPAPAPPEPTTPEAVRAEIIRWFWADGYQTFQISALLGHARDESGYRPCAAGPAGLRYLYQWGGKRLRLLYQFAGEHGGCPALDTQLGFADAELRSNPNFACFWRARTAETALAALRRGFGRGSC
jgi:hypothetical protein